MVTLSDGGQAALDWVCGGGERAVVLVVPGLTGTTHAEYVRCLAGAAHELGARCVVVNHRGLGGVPLATPRLYSAVSHGDLADAVRAVAARAPSRPLLAVGVSLGGLILGQYLAAAGREARVHAALTVSSPLDVERAATAMDRVSNAPLAWHMARNLRAAVRAHAALACHHAAVARARTVRQFDAAFTAAHFGFRSAEEYYSAATLRGKLARVAVPLLCLCAADDPFQPRAALPAAEARLTSRVALAITSRGGHIGFLEGLWPSRRSADQYIARLARQYFAALLARPALLHTPPAPAL